jgi:hypothetical protein
MDAMFNQLRTDIWWLQFWSTLLGVSLGWLLRGALTGWINRHAISPATRKAMNDDIDRAVARWFHRKHAGGTEQ